MLSQEQKDATEPYRRKLKLPQFDLKGDSLILLVKSNQTHMTVLWTFAAGFFKDILVRTGRNAEMFVELISI